MAWEVLYTNEFEQWWAELSEEQQEGLQARIMRLMERGPVLGRPDVDTIKGSRHKNMKELRVSAEGTLRVLFAFDPLREAILLIGGDKTGDWKKWYETSIPLADDLFDNHLDELRAEGKL